MKDIPHIPALRRGRPYESLETAEVKDFRTGEVKAKVSQVNAGIVRKDLQRIGESRAALKKLKVKELLAVCSRAGEQFLNGTLPLGTDGSGSSASVTQSPQQYIETLSSTSGLPHVMVRRNMAKIHDALTNMESILRGLTRGLDLSVLDAGLLSFDGEKGNHGLLSPALSSRGGEGDENCKPGTVSHGGNGIPLSFYPTTDALGLVMPSNSPAVNSLWLPAIALKIPVIIKPGKDEPWTPWRLIQAFIAAGCPAEAFGFYPTDHEGAGEILKSCGRALIFGDKSTTDRYANNPAIEIHGPGYSKILIGEDQIERWPEFIDLMASSIAENGGRSCINASTVVVPKYAKEIAEALAAKLGQVKPTPANDENARLSGFANPKMAESINATLEEGLKTPGARDVTAGVRNGSRLTQFEGGTFMQPTIVLCDSFAHPLANREFLFPYASVVQVPQSEMLKQIGPSLVVTAITEDPAFQEQLLESPLIQRLNLGPIPTMKISWDQPHEGNMFEFLYKRRAIARATSRRESVKAWSG